MKNLLKTLSLLGLIMTIAPPVLLYSGKIEMGDMKLWMGIGMLAWMLSAPFWINSKAS
jgi:hypothetical protein